MADCCNEIKARLAALEQAVAAIKPVNEDSIVQKALKLVPGLQVISSLNSGLSGVKTGLGKVEGTVNGLGTELENVRSGLERAYNLSKDAAGKAGEALDKATTASNRAGEALSRAKEAFDTFIQKVNDFNTKYQGLVNKITPLLDAIALIGGVAGLLSLFATLRLVFPRLDALDGKLTRLDNELYRIMNLIEGAYITAREARARAELAINTAFDAASQVVSAKIKAQEALDAANGANGKSAIAISDAKTAIRKADNAQGTADEARDTATSVRGIAEDAKGIAQSADSKIGNLNAEISGLRGVTNTLKQEDVRLNNRIDNIKTIDVEARRIAERAQTKANEAYDLGVTNGSKISGIQGILDIAKSDISNLKGEDGKLRNKDGDLQTQIDLLKNGKGSPTAAEVAAKLKADPGFIALTKGDPGLNGKTPKKGVDYFDGINGVTPKKGIDYRDGLNGYTPRKGIDYFDGINGINGKTPIKGKDYRDGLDGYTPKKGVDYKDGKDGISIKGDKGDSIKGDKGDKGLPGLNGKTPQKGIDYKDGKDGKDVNPADVAELKAGQKRVQDLVGNLIGNLPNMLAISMLGIRPALQPDFNTVNNNITNITNNMPTTVCSAFPAAQQTQAAVNNNTNLQIGKTNQRIGVMNTILTTINNILGSKVMGAVNTIVTTTNNIKNKVEALSKWLHLDRLLTIMNFFTNVHNAAMLSTNLAQTLFSTLDLGLQAIGFKNDKGEDISIGSVVSNTIENIVKQSLGVQTFEAVKNKWLHLNSIFNAGYSIVSTVGAMIDSSRNILEITGTYVAKIGNALKKAGEVQENAYNWMSEKFDTQTLNNDKWQKMFTNIEDIENIVTSMGGIFGEVVNIKENMNQLKENRTALKTALTASETEKATKEGEAKLNSEAPVNLTSAKIGGADND